MTAPPDATPPAGGAGPPVLLLHGFLGRGADWDAVRARLPARDVRAPDLPGHGAAVGLDDGHYTMDGAADRVLASVGGPQTGGAVDVVGYSMGARLALHLAVRHAPRVRRLVLVSGSPGLKTEAERAARRRLDAERAVAVARDLPGFLWAWYRMPLFSSLHPALRDRLVADRAAHNDASELGRSLRGMGTGAQPSHWGALAGITAPTTAVAGALDPKFVALAHAMSERLPRPSGAGPVEPVILGRAGHMVAAERPSDLAALLQSLLS
ncbi:alpha/beta fold hydrolase [Rubrivirga sp. S365]|uniref:Alpha/beta fold hydrolase n=1 Tax=Rubrivirga litoralis TaxID=3075598 RepID=A0ABU3BUX7_9BACT|nr:MULTISPECIES: alpha/beta fold hydrolase [unclassified Rubrivirga]MDT0632961.1 alpha/beta fold hydrolase [Rubrivirga sp. F394]MDT7856238.1 alpha/beta fold hydrolase [Rubrivirga sp. S365]